MKTIRDSEKQKRSQSSSMKKQEEEEELIQMELNYDFFRDNSAEEEEVHSMKAECEFLKHLLEDDFDDEEPEPAAPKGDNDDSDDEFSCEGNVEGDYDFFSDN